MARAQGRPGPARGQRRTSAKKKFDSGLALDRVSRRLERMPHEKDALVLAMGSFGEDFDADAWREAYHSMDPEAINDVRQVTAGFSELVNHCTELVRTAVSLAGLLALDRRLNAPADYLAFAKDGAISEPRAQALIRLSQVRNALAHTYTDVQADDAHQAVRDLLAELPRFSKGYGKWLTARGYELK